MPTTSSAWLERSAAVLRKEVQAELRSRTALQTLLLFAVTTLAAVSFAVGGVGLSAEVRASLFWIVLLFAAMAGLSRTFVHEEESGTAILLRLTASPNMVLFGKTVFNLALLAFLSALVIVLFGAFLGLAGVSWGLFLANVLLGIVGLAGSTTILGAMVAKAGVRSVLFPVLALPLVLPLLVTLIGGTRLAFQGEPIGAGGAEIRALLSYDGALLVASFLFFESVWRD